MEPLLFLAHRLPYPPNKGDKVRSYHFLKHLAARHDVYLGTFIDDPSDWEHVDALRSICREVHVESIVPWRQRLRSISGLVRREALTLPYFRSLRLQRWVDELLRRIPIERAFAYSSPMAQYLREHARLRRVVDFVDLDSAKWTDYARTRPWPLSAVYRREGKRLLQHETNVAKFAQAVLLVTDEERKLLCINAPEAAACAVMVRNGVDSDYFSPFHVFDSPYTLDEHAVVFTGAMDYWPNVDAVVWFAREILPEIARHDPAVRFYIVGMNPDAAVRALADGHRTIVTGRVSDVRPYLQHARVVVAPLRIARGIQNKILEAMAMQKATVVTRAAAISLKARPGVELEIADDASSFARKVVAVLDPVRAEDVGTRARARILQDYDWEASLSRLDAIFDDPGCFRRDSEMSSNASDRLTLQPELIER